MPRNYDYENATLKDLPKHWDAATNRVVSWLPSLSRPYPLENLLGTYTLVAARNQPKSLCENSPGSLGSLTLDLYAGDRLSWENISGSFSLANSALAASGRFLGLRTPEVSPFDRASFSATGIARPTLRSFELTTSYMGTVPPTGHGIEVLDVVDHNGHNYVALTLQHASGITGSNGTVYLAKRVPAGSCGNWTIPSVRNWVWG